MKNISKEFLFPKNFIRNYDWNEWGNKICEDELIGFIYIENDTILFKRRDDYNSVFVPAYEFNNYCDQEKIISSNNIAIILESPHIDEFFFSPISLYGKDIDINCRPANGYTGANIDKFLVEVFYHKLNKLEGGIYGVSLVNSIQYQCSLGVDTNYYRDRIWLDMWVNKNDLIDRLQKIKPCMIFNCTTVGQHYRLNEELNGYNIIKPPLLFTKKFVKREYRHYINTINTKYTKNTQNTQNTQNHKKFSKYTYTCKKSC